MKKLSLMLLGTLATAQFAQGSCASSSSEVSYPRSFTGFYLGGNLGWTNRKDNTNFEKFRTEVPLIEQNGIDKSNKLDGLNYGIYVGYGQNNSGFYWGGEFTVENDTINKRYTNNDLAITEDGIPWAGVNGRLNTQYKRGVVFGVSPRIGAVIANENLIYVKLGLEYSRDKVVADFNSYERGEPLGDPGHSTVSKNQFVFVPGVGYERAFGKMLARFEYGYNFGGKITSKPLAKEMSGNYQSRATMKYSAHVIKFGLAYKF